MRGTFLVYLAQVDMLDRAVGEAQEIADVYRKEKKKNSL